MPDGSGARLLAALELDDILCHYFLYTKVDAPMIEDDTTLRVGVRELRENLSAFLQQVGGGAVVHVTFHDKVIAELRPPPPRTQAPRKLGALKGKIWMAPDFDETLPEITAVMESGV
jgi:antitoxin (DNA-binding transcriptional repressor) of toxin-antitoxin stability system